MLYPDYIFNGVTETVTNLVRNSSGELEYNFEGDVAVDMNLVGTSRYPTALHIDRAYVSDIPVSFTLDGEHKLITMSKRNTSVVRTDGFVNHLTYEFTLLLNINKEFTRTDLEALFVNVAHVHQSGYILKPMSSLYIVFSDGGVHQPLESDFLDVINNRITTALNV